MSTDTQYGCPLFIADLKPSTSVQRLEPVRLQKNAGPSQDYNEAWLQKLIMTYPRLLPTDQIELAFANLIPVCTELPTRLGSIDNLFVTPTGGIALVECKLWRNPEARREVVAQIMEYAEDLASWRYEDLQDAIGKALRSVPESSNHKTLFELVSDRAEIDEASFVDAVSRNLSRGRFLLLIVGDGIREGAESLTNALQKHAGFHFTLALVELTLFRVPGGGYIVQPRIPAKTQNIERGIVTYEDSRVIVRPPNQVSTGAPRHTSITQEEYLEKLERQFPGISKKLQSFLDLLPRHEIVPEFGSTLILRWHLEWTKNWNLATIYANGNLSLEILGWQAKEAGVPELHVTLLESLAALIPGGSIWKTPKPNAWSVKVNGQFLNVEMLFSNKKYIQGWLDAMAQFQNSVKIRREQLSEIISGAAYIAGPSTAEAAQDK